MEYLMTYSWAIVILAAVIGVIFFITTSVSSPPQICVMPAGFSCSGSALSPNGLLSLNFYQSSQNPIVVTALSCVNVQSLSHMQGSNPPGNSVALPVGANYTFNVQCYSNSTAYSGSLGATFTGYIVVNYTNAYTNFPATVYGRISTKVV